MAPRKQVRTDKKTSKVLEAQPAKESKISKLKKGVSTADLFAAFPRTQKTSLEKPQPVAAKTHVQIAINPVKKNQKHFSIAYMFKAASARVHKPSPDKPQVVAVKTHVQKAVKPGRRSYGKGHTAKRPSSPSPPPQKLKKQKTQEPKHPLAKELKESIANLRGTVASNTASLIENTHNSLVSRFETGPPDSTQLATRLAEAQALASQLNVPFYDSEVKVRYRDRPNNPVHIPIGNTLSAFKKLMDGKKNELHTLYAQLDDVRRDIALLGAEILGDPEYPAKFGYKVEDPDDEKYAVNGKTGMNAAVDAMVRRVNAKIVNNYKTSLNELVKNAKEEADKEKAKIKARNAFLAMT